MSKKQRLSESGDSLSVAPKEYEGARGKKPQQARCWMLTCNMTEDPADAQSTIRLRRFNAAAQVPPCSFCVFQPEIAPETGRHHLQGYAEFEKAVSLAAVKKHFGETVHCEIRAGTQEQAIAYCTKEGEGGRIPGAEVVRFGEPMRVNAKGGTQGARQDWEDAWTRLKKGEREADVLDVHPHMLPACRALSHARGFALNRMKRDWKTRVIVLYGDAGTGKSSTAVKLAERYGEYHRVTIQNNVWFDGYDPMKHQTLILDEFTGSKMKLTFLNELLDRFPMTVETKGSSLPFLCRQVVITSNFPPDKWYDFQNQDKKLSFAALDRRLDTIIQFTLTKQGDYDRLDVFFHRGAIAHSEISSPFKKTTQKPSIHSDAPIAEYVSPLHGRKDLDSTVLIGDGTQPLEISSSEDLVKLKRKKRQLKKRK
uniref:Replication-associated protein n=1 Tax=Grus japonensis CRESS-DNA-virus sp. TaxID=2815045 RepID=A0A8A4XCE8_9VIRU